MSLSNSRDFLSFSRFKKFLEKDYKGFLEYDIANFEPKAALSYGSILHALILEPEKIKSTTIKEKKVNVRIEGYEDLMEWHALKVEDWEDIKLLAEVITTSGLWKKISNLASFEDFVYGDLEVGPNKIQKWRIKPDLFNVEQGLVLDLKTTRESTIEGIMRKDIQARHYGWQAFIYRKLLEIKFGKKFYFTNLFWSKTSEQIFMFALPDELFLDFEKEFNYHHERAVALLEAHQEKPLNLALYKSYDALLERKEANSDIFSKIILDPFYFAKLR